jgi:hypothetical protein
VKFVKDLAVRSDGKRDDRFSFGKATSWTIRSGSNNELLDSREPELCFSLSSSMDSSPILRVSSTICGSLAKRIGVLAPATVGSSLSSLRPVKQFSV